MRFLLCVVSAAVVVLTGCGTPAPKCDARTCASGCCGANDECSPGNTTNVCGSGGAACQSCRTYEACSLGQCVLATGGGSGGGGGGGATGGGGGATGGGGGSIGASCVTDATCGSGAACHPVLRLCTPTCTGSFDCPASEKTCAKINNSVASFCTCSTDALCAASVTGNICNAATSQCSARCTAGSCPTNFTCNTTSGQCFSFTIDAGTDGGVMDAGVTCNNASQPDLCGYGNVCDGNNRCDTITNGTCSNVASRPAWTSASTGPVIYLITDETFDDQSNCPANFPDGGVPTPFTVTVYAYAGSSPATFPIQKSSLPGFFFYSPSGAPSDIPLNFLQQSNYTLYDSDKVMGAKFTLCGAAGLSSLQAGFGFTNGNGACATLTH